MNKNCKPVRLFLLLLFQFIMSAVNAADDFLACLSNDTISKQKTLVILYRPDCPYCQQMDQVISNDKAFQKELSKEFRIYSLNIYTAEGKLFAEQFNIHAVPTIISLDNKTGANQIIKGFGSINKMKKQLNMTGEENKPLPILSSSPDNRSFAAEEALNTFATCGNGILEAGESCDDGNTVNGDGCSSTCTVQSGYQCTGNPSACVTICGDGIKVGSESCDDGNTNNGDGCSNTCTAESGYMCTGSPSACVGICGDGIKVAGEQCDDGNTNNGDGCSSTCLLENGTGGILIKNGAGTADYSAMLDINSTQRGVLIPRMTTAQRNSISGPATGLMVFDNTTNSFWFYGGTAWREIKNDAANVAFSASIPAIAQNTSPGTIMFVAFPTEDFDDGGNNYNTTTSLYTVPATGVYEFSATVSVNVNSSPASTTSYTMTVYESQGFTTHTVGTSTIAIPASYIGGFNLSASGTVKLTAGTGGTVKVTITSSANSTAQPIAAGKFSGHRVY